MKNTMYGIFHECVFYGHDSYLRIYAVNAYQLRKMRTSWQLRTPSQNTDTGHDIPPHNNIHTQEMTSHPVTVYRHRT